MLSSIQHGNGTVIRCGYPAPFGLKYKTSNMVKLALGDSLPVSSPKSISHGCLLRHSSVACSLPSPQQRTLKSGLQLYTYLPPRLTSWQPHMSSLTHPGRFSSTAFQPLLRGGNPCQFSPETVGEARSGNISSGRAEFYLFVSLYHQSPASTTERVF